MQDHYSIYLGYHAFLQQTENGWTLEIRNQVDGPRVDACTFSAANLPEAISYAQEFTRILVEKDRLRATIATEA